MFTFTTTQGSTPTGAGKVTARGMGKQKSVRTDLSKSVSDNHASAVYALMFPMLTDEQVAKMRHPSAAGRITCEVISQAGGKMRWTVNV